MVTPASSWQEWHQHKYSGDARQLAFLSAHAWQHESLQLRAVSNDGFLVMVGLFLVLILENIWSFDPGAFSSVALANGFVTALVLGAACGLFTLFSTAMVTAKLKRLLARDTCNLHVQQPGKHKKSSLDRLVRRWQQYPADHQWQAASIAYEWYHGAQAKENYYNRTWDPRRPRSLVKISESFFVVMVLASMAALAVRLADAQGVGFSVFSTTMMVLGTVLPTVAVKASTKDPPGMSASESNPFGEFS